MKNLPKVHPAIGASIEHELLKHKKDDIYLEKHLQKIKEENPVISFWLETFSKTTKDKNGSLFCGLIVFRMLQIQAECDQMKLDIKL
jgi:hypothetical protein